jgi:hypothetical protein
MTIFRIIHLTTLHSLHILENRIHICKEIGDQLFGGLEHIGCPFMFWIRLLVVIGDTPARKTTTLPGLDGMSIVESQQPLAVPVMQGQAVSDPMRALPGRLIQFPHLDLYPALFVLGKDLTIEIQQVIQSLVMIEILSHSYHRMIK